MFGYLLVVSTFLIFLVYFEGYANTENAKKISLSLSVGVSLMKIKNDIVSGWTRTKQEGRNLDFDKEKFL